MATSRALVDHFARVGNDISHGLGGSLSKAFAAVDGTAARRDLLALQQEWRRAADVEADAAARMIRDQRRLAEATVKYGDDSSRTAAAQAMLARSQRDHIDAMIAAEAAHGRLAKAGNETADSVSRMQKLGANPIFNAAGIGSVAAMGIGLVSATDAAGNFQQSLQRLHTVAEESPANLKAISDGVLKLSSVVGYAPQKLMDAALGVEKAGYRGSDAIKVLTASAQLASEEGADLGETISAVTTTMHDYHIPVEQAANVTSKLNVAVGLSKVSLQDFAGALHNVEPVAAGVGESVNDLYASLAMLTQSGMGADQATQNMTHAITSLAKPTQQMSQEMGQLGLDARDIQEHFGERGLIGTANLLYDTIQSKLGPSGMVTLDAWFKSKQVADSANEMFSKLPAQAQAVATAIQNNAEAYKQFRKDRGGLSVEEANLVEQWWNQEKALTGFNNQLKSGKGDVQSMIQALALMVGGQDNLRTVLQLVGENGPKAAAAVKEVSQAQADGAGNTKGFTESQETYNAKMKDFKGALSAARIEIGQDFLPAMTEVVGVLGESAHWLTEHKPLLDAVTVGVGAMCTAWLAIKGYNIASTILSPIGTGLGMLKDKLFSVETQATTASTAMRNMGPAAMAGEAEVLAAADAEVAAEGRVTAAAGEANAALSGGRTGGAGLAAAAGPLGIAAAGSMAANDIFGSLDRRFHTNLFTKLGEIPGSGAWVAGQLFGHAEGGPLHAPGPKGHDSALFWGADGEHVLTHHEVQKMGGHSGVYKFRSDLMNGRIVLGRAGGGALGYGGMAPDVAVASSLAGTPYSQGARDDCSGMVGRVILGAMGLPATNLPTTKNMGQWLAALGFQPGIGGPGSISVGWYDHGPNPNDGHAAMTLSNGENAEAGGSHGNFVIGAGAAGAASSQFDHHMFLPTLYGEGAATGMPGFAAGMGAGGFGGMGGGIPPGATPGTGPGGQPGYYTANPQRVAAAEERLRHLDAEIDNAEKRRSELKATAKQSERDRLDEEIRHLKAERTQEQQRLAEAERGTFHAMHGHRGAGGGENPFLPVPLADQFGLSKGLPGLAEWTVGFLEDLVLGPLETAAWAAIGQAPPGAGGTGGGFGGLSAPGGLGAARFGFPNPAPLAAPPGAAGADDAAAAGLDTARGNTTGQAPSSGGGAGAGGGSEFEFVKSPSKPGLPLGPLARPPAPDSAPPPADYKSWYGQGASDSFYRTWYPTPLGPVPTPSPNAYGPPSHGSDWRWGPVHVAPPAPPGPMKSPLEQQQSMLGGAGSGGPLPSGPKPLPMGPFIGGDPRWGTAHFASGGPSGTDTIPAWLSPHEYVEPSEAVDKYGPGFMDAIRQGRIDPTSVRYYAPGGEVTDQPEPPPQQQAPAQQPQNMVKAPGAPGGPAIEPPPGAPKPGDNASIHEPTGPGAVSPGSKQGLSDTATPGADVQQPGTGQGALPGIGFSGGIIGGLEGAATQAAAMGADMGTFGGAGGAVSSAMNIGFQELNRAAAYGAQDVGIGVEGLLEALIPNSDATGADWSKTIPGRLLMGVTGVRTAGQQNTAGQTQQPFASNASSDQYANVGNTQPQAPIQIMGPVHVQANDPKQLHEGLNSQAAMANSANMIGTQFRGTAGGTG